jgi:hypothetical protein
MGVDTCGATIDGSHESMFVFSAVPFVKLQCVFCVCVWSLAERICTTAVAVWACRLSRGTSSSPPCVCSAMLYVRRGRSLRVQRGLPGSSGDDI